MVTIGYSVDLSQPMRPPLPQPGVLQAPVQTCVTNCSQTVPDTTVVCTDTLWEHTIALASTHSQKG